MYSSFGFTDNIFNTYPLDLCEKDLEKFIGRVKDIRSFSIDISSQNRATILVTGQRGVGKTSFVNVMEYASIFRRDFFKEDLSIPYLIPCYHKIQIEPEEDTKTTILKSLSSILYSIERFAKERKEPKRIPKKIKELTEWVSSIVSIGGAMQVSLAGFGGGLGRTKQYKNISEISTNVLSEKINEVVGIAKDFFGLDGIFLNINNIDILDEKSFCETFNQLRDYLLNIDGLWNILIGYPGLYSSLYQQAARVAEVISGQETKLNPLSEEEMIRVLKIRQEVYSKNPKELSPLPIEEDFIRDIYKNSDGEIRSVLKACDDIVRAAFKENPNIKSIGSAAGKPFLRKTLQDQLSLNNLKDKEKDFLKEIEKRGSLRPRDYSDLKLKSSVDFINRARPLLSKNLLTKEVIGNVANYKVTGVIKLAVYSGIKI